MQNIFPAAQIENSRLSEVTIDLVAQEYKPSNQFSENEFYEGLMLAVVYHTNSENIERDSCGTGVKVIPSYGIRTP